MEIRVINAIVEKWQSYNKVLTLWNLLEKRRLELGQTMRLREYDINQHLIYTLRDHGKNEQYAMAKETILEIVQAIDVTDKKLICNLYRSLYDELKSAKDFRYNELSVVQVNNSSADLEKDLQRAKEEVEALLAEKKDREAYITKYKKRNWWQRLWNKDVDLCDINLLKVGCKCPNRVAESK